MASEAFPGYNAINKLIIDLSAANARIDKAEPQDLVNLRTGQVKIGAGNQYYSPWEFAVGMFRDAAMMNWYPMLQKVVETQLYSREVIVDSIKKENAPFMKYLQYNMFIEMNELYDRFLELADKCNRVQLRMIIEGFLRYFNRYTSYALYYFDYKVGGDKYQFTPLPEDAPQADLSRRVSIKEGPRMKMSWPKLSIVVYARLALKENPALVRTFMQALPTENLHLHVFVSGESSYSWVPVTTIVDATVKERQCDAPVGRLRFSKLSGQKIVIQHGPVTEDIETPVLGEVEEKYRGLLPQLGHTLWKDTYETKEGITLKMEMVDENDDPTTAPDAQTEAVIAALAEAMQE